MGTEQVHDVDRALVLGPGGRPGVAWTAGLAAGLRSAGVDLGEADLIVGTSAGAIVGAVLAAGGDPARLGVLPARLPADGAVTARRPDPAVTGAVFAALGESGADPAGTRRRVGRIALGTVDAAAEERVVAQRAALIGVDTWPEHPRLLIPAVDAESGEPVVWEATAGVPLVRAVAASSAFPGFEPPVAVDGRHCLDGALRAGTNADLAAGARTVVVVEPLAHRHPGAAPGSARVLAPEADAVRLLDADPGDHESWEEIHRLGRKQGEAAADGLRAFWRPRS
ncbi:patatin-like phospholipase family protein [Kitasatospora sp. NPDC094019]|uniref:patatin-like phospholipase family protein n=1 Tax=Kitasatospora sp. NPDC094019 TaxID=3364091 RepID=UPI00382EDCD9